ncbi:MAG: type 1 glutamine amidotransferase domain-containing protein [Halioglobus sp.]
MSSVLIPLPLIGFDPTEVAVPWQVLSRLGHEIVFTSPDGSMATADPIMVTGRGLGPLKYLLRADANGRAAYQEMITSDAFNSPLSYEQAAAGNFDALMLPGGHAKSVKPYLESELIQQIAAGYIDDNKPVGAICHGVLVLARAKRKDGSPVLQGRKVTSLVNRLENTGYQLTRLWMGDYYRTYPEITTEDEVRRSLASNVDFDAGPPGIRRDSTDKLHIGFTVRDGNLLTARWPGDVHRWSVEMGELLGSKASLSST